MIERYGHEATAKDPPIAVYAQTHQVCLLTGDFGFADIRNYVPAAYGGLVVLELPRNATAAFIVCLVESLLRQPEVVAKIVGRLAIVAAGRVRLRPP